MPSAVISGPGVRCDHANASDVMGGGGRAAGRARGEAAKGTPVVRGFSLRSSMPRRQVRAADRPDRWTEKGRKPSGQPGACPPEHRSPRGISGRLLTPCSYHPPASTRFLSATRQQYFYLRTNQSSLTSQQCFSLRTNQHQSSATSQTNRLQDSHVSSVFHQITSLSSRPPVSWTPVDDVAVHADIICHRSHRFSDFLTVVVVSDSKVAGVGLSIKNELRPKYETKFTSKFVIPIVTFGRV
jgi:hypothetical protein